MRAALTTLLVLLGIAVIAVYSSVFTVHQTQQAMVLDFGKPSRVITEPGLNWLIPFVQSVEVFDKRNIDLDATPREVILADQKRIVVDTFARYKIINPLQYYQSVRNEIGAQQQLNRIIEAAMRRVLGSVSLNDVVRDKRADLMEQIQRMVNDESKVYGVEIIDVRIKRADVPEQNREAIYARMRTERQREASEIRAQGEEQSRRIKATADRQVVVTKAEATRKSEITRGEGDAERNRIYAEVFSKDPDFFNFYRSMQAYEQSLKSGDTRMVLSPDSDFFRYFSNPAGTPPKAPAANP
jgi:membrane protease subunit HflC